MAQTWFKGNTVDDGQENDLISDEEDAGGDTVEPKGPAARGNQALDNVSMSTSLRQVQDSSNPVYTSQWASFLIIINVTVGIGLLAMPYCMQTAGVVTSIVVQLLFLALTIITCIMCIEMTVKSEVGSYHEIIQRHCNKFAYQFTQISILLCCFGSVVAFIEIVGDQSDRFFSTKVGPDFCKRWYMNRRFVMSFVTLVAIKPLCSTRTVDFLKYVSFLGFLSIGFIFYVVVLNFKGVYPNFPKDVNYYPESWAQIASILPVLCLAYQCHLSLVPTVATVHRSQKPKSFITISITMITAMIIYSAVSILAVLTFGGKILKDLTENFAGEDLATVITIAIVGFKCVLTLPAAYLPARLSVIDILAATFPRFAATSETFKRISVTIVFLDLSLLTALYVPSILVMVNLLGCVAVTLIFILPSVAYLNLVKENRLEKQRGVGGQHDIPEYTSRDQLKRITSYCMIVIGSILTTLVLYESIKDITNSKSSPPLCVP